MGGHTKASNLISCLQGSSMSRGKDRLQQTAARQCWEPILSAVMQGLSEKGASHTCQWPKCSPSVQEETARNPHLIFTLVPLRVTLKGGCVMLPALFSI